jgi:hypothetical protein
MSYLKLKLKDYLKTIDTDDMTTLSIQQRIKNLINVSGNIQDTIGRAAYGEAKFEKKIFPIKDKNIIKADFTPEEIKELDKKFERIIEQAETPTNKDEDFNG